MQKIFSKYNNVKCYLLGWSQSRYHHYYQKDNFQNSLSDNFCFYFGSSILLPHLGKAFKIESGIRDSAHCAVK